MSESFSRALNNKIVVLSDVSAQLNQIAEMLHRSGYSFYPYIEAETLINDLLGILDSHGVDPVEQPPLPSMFLLCNGTSATDVWGICKLLRSSQFSIFRNVPVFIVVSQPDCCEMESLAMANLAQGVISASLAETDFMQRLQGILSGKDCCQYPRILLVEKDRRFAGEFIEATRKCRWEVTFITPEKFAQMNPDEIKYNLLIIQDNCELADYHGLIKNLRLHECNTAFVIYGKDLSARKMAGFYRQGFNLVISDPLNAFELVARAKQSLRENQAMLMQKKYEFNIQSKKEVDERFRLAMDATKDGVWDWNVSTGEVYYSPGYLAMLGYRFDETESSFDFWQKKIHPEDREEVLKANQDCVENRVDSFEIEFRMQCKNGEWRWIFGRGRAVRRDEFGKALRMVGTHADITSHRRNEEALRESEWRFQKMLSLVPDMISIHDLEMNIVYSNWNGFGAVARDRRVRFTKCYRTYRGYHEPCPDCRARNVVETGKEYHSEEQLPDGTWIDLRIIPLLDSNGEVELFVEWIRDITDKKLSEAELRESEAKYRRYVDGAPNGIFVSDEKGNYLEVNKAACRLTGYSKKELLGMSISDIIAPEDREKAIQHFNKVKSFGQASGEVCHQGKYGRKRYCRIDTVKISDTRFLGFTTDLTDLKRAEAEIRMAHQTYKGILDSISESVYIQAENQAFLDVNESATRFYGYSKDEIIGRAPSHLSAPGKNDFNVLQEKFVRAFNGEPQRMEFWGKKADGTVFPKDLALVPGSYFGQKAVIAVARDITEQKKAESEREALQAQLIQAQKMESVGRLAGGVAHDFNNMLNVILGHAELALDRLSADHPVFGDLSEIRKAARRSADLTRQLLAFARKQTVIPRVLDLNETVSGMLRMLQRMIGEQIKLRWVPAEDLWPVRVDPSQVDQIMANLCVNSRDAIKEAGIVTIETANFRADKEFCRKQAGISPGEYVKIIVTDDGHGMSPEVLQKLFEPFFTTKEIGKGTGLGLATVYGIVKQNNGLITVASEIGKGSSFVVFLPRFDGEVERKGPETKIVTGEKVNETVLVVEDEPMILNMARLMLERLGYRVLAADSPAKAIKLAEDHTGDIHLLMTDVIMPEMNGRDLAQQIIDRFPNIKSLYMSGYTANLIAQHGVLDGGMHFIQKPFSLYNLAAKLRDVIDAK
jgi:PAS domain S-box-containing protein